VGAAADPRLLSPLHGSWRGMRADFLGMDVKVDIDVEDEAATQPDARLRVAGAG